MITNSISSLKFDSPVEERKSKYGFHMIVKNHFGQDVFEYFGNTGQVSSPSSYTLSDELNYINMLK